MVEGIEQCLFALLVRDVVGEGVGVGRELGSYLFSALYQQSPQPPAGLLFKRGDFRYWRPHLDEPLYLLEREDGELRPIGIDWCTHFQTVDVAASATPSTA